MRRSMLRLYPDTMQFNEKNSCTISEFFPCFEFQFVAIEFSICMRRSMLRLYPDTMQFNEKNSCTISEFFPCFEFQFVAIEFRYFVETLHATSQT